MHRGEQLLRLTIRGQAAGSGSKTAEPLGKRFHEARDENGRIILAYRPSSKFTKPWMDAVAREAALAWGSAQPLCGALWLDVFFYEVRPSSHYRQLVSGPVLRTDAPAYPDVTRTHDVDKLRRAISDALTHAAVLADDKRVIGGEAWKNYAENIEEREPFVVIEVGPMLEQTVADLGIVSPAPPDQAQLLAA